MSQQIQVISESPVVKRLMWGGLLALVGAVASVVAHRLAARIWWQLFEEEPPE